MKIVKYFAVLVVCLMLQACLGSPRGPIRFCPPYNVSGSSIWVPGLVGTSYRYSSQSGDSKEYAISEVRMSPAYAASTADGNGTADDVYCRSSREITMLAANGVQGLRLRITHLDWPRRPNEFDISVSLISFIINDEARTDVQKMELGIFNIEDMGLGQWENHGYSETLEFDGRSYEHVLSVFGPDADFSNNPDTKNSPNAIKRFVVARGDGLIQFERNDSVVFDLVSVE